MDWAGYIPFKGDFDEIESFLGLSLPDDLKDVIKNYNKGCPLKSQFSYGDETDEIERFISFNRDGESNIYDYFVDDLQERKLLPFATTENDNILLLEKQQGHRLQRRTRRRNGTLRERQRIVADVVLRHTQKKLRMPMFKRILLNAFLNCLIFPENR